MTSRTFQTVGEVLTADQLRYEQVVFTVPSQEVDVPQQLLDEVALPIREIDYRVSVAAIGETLIHPVLREVWKQFTDTFAFRSHQAILPTFPHNPPLTACPNYSVR